MAEAAPAAAPAAPRPTDGGLLGNDVLGKLYKIVAEELDSSEGREQLARRFARIEGTGRNVMQARSDFLVFKNSAGAADRTQAYGRCSELQTRLQECVGNLEAPGRDRFNEMVRPLLSTEVNAKMGDDPRPSAQSEMQECQAQQATLNRVCSSLVKFIEDRKKQAQTEEVENLEQQFRGSLSKQKSELEKSKEDMEFCVSNRDGKKFLVKFGELHLLKVQGRADIERIRAVLDSEQKLREDLRLEHNDEDIPAGSVLLEPFIHLIFDDKSYTTFDLLNGSISDLPADPSRFTSLVHFKKSRPQNASEVKSYDVRRSVRVADAFHRECANHYLSQRFQGDTAEYLKKLVNRVFPQKGAIARDETKLEAYRADYFKAIREKRWDGPQGVFDLLGKCPGLIDEVDKRYGAIHQAAEFADVEVVRRLVEEFSANIILLTSDRKTPAEVASPPNKQYLESSLQSRPNIDALATNILIQSADFLVDAEKNRSTVQEKVEALTRLRKVHEEILKGMEAIVKTGEAEWSKVDNDCLAKQDEVFRAFEVLAEKLEACILAQSCYQAWSVGLWQYGKKVAEQKERLNGVCERLGTAEATLAAIENMLEAHQPMGQRACDELASFRRTKVIDLLTDHAATSKLHDKALESAIKRQTMLTEQVQILKAQQAQMSGDDVYTIGSKISTLEWWQGVTKDQEVALNLFTKDFADETNTFSTELALTNCIVGEDVQRAVQELWGHEDTDKKLQEFFDGEIQRSSASFVDGSGYPASFVGAGAASAGVSALMPKPQDLEALMRKVLQEQIAVTTTSANTVKEIMEGRIQEKDSQLQEAQKKIKDLEAKYERAMSFMEKSSVATDLGAFKRLEEVESPDAPPAALSSARGSEG